MPETHLLHRRHVEDLPSHDADSVDASRVAHRAANAAYRVLQAGFIALPMIAGLDKFTRTLVDWDHYVSQPVANLLPFSVHTFMLIVGLVEISAGLLIAVLPRIGGFVAAAWLCGIGINLLLPPGYYDIALRDFGLATGALALALLAREFDEPLGGTTRGT
jgi:hypothetical protein